MTNDDKDIWVEIFNLPRHRHIENEDTDRIQRIPKHTFKKIEVK